ncbi:MAG: hypothetical protein SVR08_17480 [Spirochaetota bacterium]|nr:hypothetical protein [Spirochaetota bacterium]
MLIYFRSSLKNLQIENSTLSDTVYLEDTRFENLSLKEIKYEDDYRIDDKGVEYINSDEFPLGCHR